MEEASLWIDHHVPVHLDIHPEPVPTEVLGIPASSPQPELQVLVVPGNPGNAGYYRTLMTTLHTALGGTAHVLSCSHAGHNVHPSNSGSKLWTLEEQIHHKVSFIRQHLLLPGRPPLVVLGHSVGAYMAVHAIQKLEARMHGTHQAARQPDPHAPQPHQQPHLPSPYAAISMQGPPSPMTHADMLHPAVTSGLLGSPATKPSFPQQAQPPHTYTIPSFLQKAQQGNGHATPTQWPQPQPLPMQQATHSLPHVHKVVALMPFFQADLPNQWRQRGLRFLSRRYHFMAALAAALRLLPLTLRMAFVRWWTRDSMDRAAVQTTAQLLHPKSIKNNFYMAKTEFRDMSRPFPWELLARLGPRLHVMACPRDVWMSDKQYHHMRQQLPGLQATWHPDLEHAFCVSRRQCEEVTRHISHILRSSLPSLRNRSPDSPPPAPHGSHPEADGEKRPLLSILPASSAVLSNSNSATLDNGAGRTLDSAPGSPLGSEASLRSVASSAVGACELPDPVDLMGGAGAGARRQRMSRL